jgi:hypothetical protein
MGKEVEKFKKSLQQYKQIIVDVFKVDRLEPISADSNKRFDELVEKTLELENELIEMFENVQSDFECAKNNTECFRAGADILRARLDKVYTFLEGKGYTVKEVNEIVRLDCERS